MSWFRTSWQRGGAATGYATWRADSGVEKPVVVKLPVPPVELMWLNRLQYGDESSGPEGAGLPGNVSEAIAEEIPEGIAPRVYASGEAIGSYDLAWAVMERLPHGPIGPAWNGAEFDRIVQAIVRFYQATQRFEVGPPAPEKDWKRICSQARKHIADDHDVAHEQRWKNALKAAQKKLGFWLGIWNARPRRDWCHGDLQLANAMTRVPAPGGPAVLIDYALVHVGHWVEDAVYLEHLFWSRRQRLGGRKLVSMIAHERHRVGLPVEPDWPLLAATKRALLALSVPAQLQAEGDRQHVQAALEVLEIELK